MKICVYCGQRYPDEATLCSVDGQILEEAAEPGRPIKDQSRAKVVCPKCGAPDDYKPALELRGSFSWILFFAGGIWAVLIRNAGRTRKVRCDNCSAIFEIQPPLARTTRLIFWVLVCPAIIGGIILVLRLLMILLE